MERIDFRVQGNFLGEEVYINPCNGENRQKVQDALGEMNELKEITNWYDEKAEKIQSDKRLKDDTKEKKLRELDEEFTEKAQQYLDDVIEYRKKLCDIIFEFKDEFPEDEFFGTQKFDDYALNRALDFFLRPQRNLKPEQSNGSSS